MSITAEANAARFTAHYANPDTRTVLRTVGDLLLCKHVARDGDVVVVDPIRRACRVGRVSRLCDYVRGPWVLPPRVRRERTPDARWRTRDPVRVLISCA